MTSLVSWIGADQRGPASAYIATDSRISWEGAGHWDHGRKVFASRARPELFAYVGDVLFPSLILGQLVTAIDEGLIFTDGDSPQQRADKIADAIQLAFQSMPSATRNGFQVLYVTREDIEMNSTFHAFAVEWSPQKEWVRSSLSTPQVSDTVVIWGSGSESIRKWRQRWNQSSQKNTSRAVFSAFCDSVLDGADPKSGGAVQLVGIYRIGPGRTFGIVSGGGPYVFGLNVGNGTPANTVKWHNRYFERCDPDGKKIEEGQAHHVPKGLGGKA
jgi:hypothetical protein